MIPADSADCEFRGSIETLSFPGIVGLKYELIEGEIRGSFDSASFRSLSDASRIVRGNEKRRDDVEFFFFS